VELRHLRYLVAIADAGTFVRAAEHLRVAQPALTRQIHDLEEELGVELFDPAARKATLTTAGEACARLARHVIQDTERAVERARLSNKGLAGTCILVSGPLPLLSGAVARLVARIKAVHPGITLVIREGVLAEQWDAVANGEADIGLGAAPSKDYPSLAMETMYVDTADIALLAPDHPLAGREQIVIDDLRGFQLLILENIAVKATEAYNLFVQEIKHRKFVPAAPREFASLESLIAHVQAGQGWTLMTRRMMSRFPPLVGVPIADFRAPFPTVRIWRRADKRPLIHTVLRELQNTEQEFGEVENAAQPSDDRKPQVDRYLPARIELRHLRSFSDLAKYGSMGRAAEIVGITQPALSRQMRDLEYDVGVDLLERGTRGVELTAPGQVFLDDVNDLLTVVDHLSTEVQRAKRGAAQRCVIGVVPHPHIDKIVATVLADLETRGVRVRAGTRAVGTPFQVDALTKSEIDIGIGFAYPARVPASEHFTRVRLFDDELSFALLPAKHPLAKRSSLSLADLKDVPFIFPGRETFPPVYDVVMHQFSAAGVRPRVDAEYEGVHTIWSLTGEGVGWCLGLREQAHFPPPGTTAIPLRDFKLPWGAELVYRKDESRAAILTAIDAIIDRARQMFPPIAAVAAQLPPSHTSETVIS